MPSSVWDLCRSVAQQLLVPLPQSRSELGNRVVFSLHTLQIVPLAQVCGQSCATALPSCCPGSSSLLQQLSAGARSHSYRTLYPSWEPAGVWWQGFPEQLLASVLCLCEQ